MTSAAPGAPLAASAEPPPPGWPGLPADPPLAGVRRLVSRIATLCWVELRKIRHDRTELYTRAIQPALWLLIFGETFSRIHAIAVPNGIPYLDFLAPGILAQSTLFIAIFYGIQIIWERDAGVLAKLMVTPTPRAALITGKAFAAGVRSIVQAAVIVVLSAVLGVALTLNPLKLLGVVLIVVLGSAFFSCLSMSIAGSRAVAGPADGHRPGDHHAAVLQLERALPGKAHARLATGDQQGEPALLRGERPALAAHRGADQPGAGHRRPRRSPPWPASPSPPCSCPAWRAEPGPAAGLPAGADRGGFIGRR